MRSSIEWTQKNLSKESESLWVKKKPVPSKTNNKAGKKNWNRFFFFFDVVKVFDFPVRLGGVVLLPSPAFHPTFFRSNLFVFKKKNKKNKEAPHRTAKPAEGFYIWISTAKSITSSNKSTGKYNEPWICAAASLNPARIVIRCCSIGQSLSRLATCKCPYFVAIFHAFHLN